VFTWFPYLKAINDVFTEPILRIIFVLPSNIGVLPEVVDELLRLFEGAERFPPGSESRQLCRTKQHSNDLRVFTGVIVPFPLDPEAQQKGPTKAVRGDKP